jgi:hypothetical protein
LVQTNGWQRSFQPSMNRSMAAIGTAPFKTHNDDGGIHGQLHLTDVADNRPVARVLQLIGLAEIRSHDFDRRSEREGVCPGLR